MSRWTAERWAASSGMAFAVVFFVGNFIAGVPPKYNATSDTIVPVGSPDKIVAYLQDHHTALTIQGILSGVLIVLFVWFLSSFAGLYREAGQRRLSTVMYGAGVVGVALAAAGDAIQLGITQLVASGHRSGVESLYGVSNFFYLKTFWAVTALAVATALATRRSKALPEWYGMLTTLAAVIFLLGGLSVRSYGFFSLAGAMPFITFIAFGVWVFISSAVLVRKTP